MLRNRCILFCFAVLTGVLLAADPALGQTTWRVDDNAPGDPAPGDPNVSDPLEDIPSTPSRRPSTPPSPATTS